MKSALRRVWRGRRSAAIFYLSKRLKRAAKEKLLLTGQLGEVMQESAQAAFSFAKARAEEIGIDQDLFDQYDIHVPSAGRSNSERWSRARELQWRRRLSQFCHSVRSEKDLAMTGEITLRGNVLPVGGVKEKLLAARRAHIKTVILPAPNERDLEDLSQEVLNDLTFIFVENVREVFQ